MPFAFLVEAEILRTAQALEALQSLKSVLTHPAYSGNYPIIHAVHFVLLALILGFP